MARTPYTFPHRSRLAMLDYLLPEDRRNDPRSSHHGRFQWDVKVHASVPTKAAALQLHLEGEGIELDPTLDAEWASVCDDEGQRFNGWCEDASRSIDEGEWTSYPGNDQGDWKFHFRGRQGGWLVLHSWRGMRMDNQDRHELRWDMERWDMDRLRAFYKGIRTADADFTPEKATKAVLYAAAWDRSQWEETKHEEREAEAEDMALAIAAERPDLAPSYLQAN